MAELKQLRLQQTVLVTYPWMADELPSDENFHIGKILEIVERRQHCFYVRVEGKASLVPIDRVVILKRHKPKNLARRIRRKGEKFQQRLLKLRNKNYVKKTGTRI